MAYRIARCIQRCYRGGRFIVVVDTVCKSAGTLIALGADQIVMSPLAELGPLDVQVAKPDALGELTSGLTPTHAMFALRSEAFKALESFFLDLRLKSNFQITTRTALDVSADLVAGLFQPVFAQIDPMRLGEIRRAMTVGTGYGERLARGNQKHNTLERLTENYPSHDFVIDIDEAKTLFDDVREPTEKESQLLPLLANFVEKGNGVDADEPFVILLNVLLDPPQTETKPDDSNQPRAVSKEGAGTGPGNDGEAGAEARNGKPARRRGKRVPNANKEESPPAAIR